MTQMLGINKQDLSPYLAYILCSVLVLIAFGMFGFALDRYPQFYVDESFFNASAVRYLGGQSFGYILHSQAPHGESVWAYHGPFFFRFQVLTFKLLGVSHFACRIPSYAGANLAVLLLCFLLLRKGMYKTAIVLSVVWIGDRSLLQTTLGRPEGVSLLLVVLGYGCLINALGEGKMSWLCGMSFCIGMAAGFNPAAAFMGLAACTAVLVFVPMANWMKSFAFMFMGTLIPVGLVLICWAPHLAWSLEQFLWYLNFSTKVVVPSLWNRLSFFGLGLGWAKYWYLALFSTTILVLFPLSLRLILKDRHRVELNARQIVAVTAAFFAFGAILLYFKSSMHPYYLVFFSTWPVLALAGFWENANGRLKSILVVVLLAIGAGWLPSFAWNGMRFRETILFYKILDKQPLITQLTKVVPGAADVRGDPKYFIAARNAGLHFTPLPFYVDDSKIDVPSHAWLLLSPDYSRMLGCLGDSPLLGRELVYRDTIFDGSRYTRDTYTIYSPKNVATSYR
jgi:hypothetical protein